MASQLSFVQQKMINVSDDVGMQLSDVRHELTIEVNELEVHKDIEPMKARTFQLDTQIDEMIEAKMVKTAEEAEINYNSELDNMRKEIIENDEKMDSVCD